MVANLKVATNNILQTRTKNKTPSDIHKLNHLLWVDSYLCTILSYRRNFLYGQYSHVLFRSFECWTKQNCSDLTQNTCTNNSNVDKVSCITSKFLATPLYCDRSNAWQERGGRVYRQYPLCVCMCVVEFTHFTDFISSLYYLDDKEPIRLVFVDTKAFSLYLVYTCGCNTFYINHT